MNNRLTILLLFIVLLLLLFNLQKEIDQSYLYPYQAIPTMGYIEQSPFLEWGGLFLGLRCLASDMVWIDTLQYYGAHEEEVDSNHEEEAGDHHHDLHDLDQTAYLKLLPLCQRAVWLDPYFMHVYVMGGAAVGYVQERYDEAMLLLKKGVLWNYNPGSLKYWRMNMALAAMTHLKAKDYKGAIEILEKVVSLEESPLILLRVLANTYEKYGYYQKAYKMWNYILNNYPEDRERALRHLKEIEKYL